MPPRVAALASAIVMSGSDRYLAVQPPSTMSVVPVTSEARRREVDDRARDVDRLADAMEPGDPLEHVGLERRVGERGRGAGRADERRRDRVDVDAVSAPFDREAAGQVGDGGLRGAIDGLARQRHEACLRAEVDDAARSPARSSRARPPGS